MRHQFSALAFSQVVAGGLAGDRGVAEDAEQIVLQLERLPEREGELAVGIHQRCCTAGEDASQREGVDRGVVSRFELEDRPRAAQRDLGILGRDLDLVQHVQVLPDHHLEAHGVEASSSRRCRAGTVRSGCEELFAQGQA